MRRPRGGADAGGRRQRLESEYEQLSEGRRCISIRTAIARLVDGEGRAATSTGWPATQSAAAPAGVSRARLGSSRSLTPHCARSSPRCCRCPGASARRGRCRRAGRPGSERAAALVAAGPSPVRAELRSGGPRRWRGSRIARPPRAARWARRSGAERRQPARESASGDTSWARELRQASACRPTARPACRPRQPTVPRHPGCGTVEPWDRGAQRLGPGGPSSPAGSGPTQAAPKVQLPSCSPQLALPQVGSPTPSEPVICRCSCRSRFAGGERDGGRGSRHPPTARFPERRPLPGAGNLPQRWPRSAAGPRRR